MSAWAKRSTRRARPDASSVATASRRGASFPSCIRRWASSCRRSGTGCPPGGGAGAPGRKPRGHAVTAGRKLSELYQTMGKLLPQIRHWLRTGRVAAGKIINLYIPELYSIVRGKVGKAVEFGLSWGLTRLRGGFVLATMAHERGELHDAG